MRIVRNRSIPHVDTERLQADLESLHQKLHTTEGLRDFDRPRRSLVELGVKCRLIWAELDRRGAAPTKCRFCSIPRSA